MLVNIWIPSVFITGSGASKHHVYQVVKKLGYELWIHKQLYIDPDLIIQFVTFTD